MLNGRIFMIIVLVILTAIYFGILMFGNNSVTSLMKVEQKNNFYADEVLRLRSENAALQKEYFELKILEPEND